MPACIRSRRLLSQRNVNNQTIEVIRLPQQNVTPPNNSFDITYQVTRIPNNLGRDLGYHDLHFRPW